jgi:hypothetical protein
MSGIRILIGAVIALIAVVVLLPMLALLDLAGGGTGFGLCPGGLGSCRSSYFDGPELAGILVLIVVLLFVVLRTLIKARDAVEGHAGRDRQGRTSVGAGRRPGR